MFGDERASAKEINPFFGAAPEAGLSGFRDNETGDARAYVQSPHLRLLQTTTLLDLKPNIQFYHNRSIGSCDTEKGCARADARHP